MRLKEHEYLSLIRTIKECYVLCDLETFPTKVLPALMKTVSAEIISYNECNPTQKQVRAAWEPSCFTIAQDDLAQFEIHMHENPLISFVRSGVYKISDFMKLDKFQNLAIYNEFYRPLGVNYQIAVTFACAGKIIGFAFNRNRSDFSETDRMKLKLLFPNLLQAYNNANLFSKVQFPSPPLPLRAYCLSAREIEVLSWVAHGKANVDVGYILGISPRTVQKHLENIYTKLGVETRTAAAAIFIYNEAKKQSRMEYE